MGSVHDIERIGSIRNNSPLRHHSMNQRVLDNSRQGFERGNIPRKVMMAERKRARLAQQNLEWCETRRTRVFDRVQECLRKQATFGYDGTIPQVLAAELRYLERTNSLNNR